MFLTKTHNYCRRLFLSDNMISDVGRGTFSAITRIGTIDLARNQIKKVDFQMFSQLNYVEVNVENGKEFNRKELRLTFSFFFGHLFR